jgi:hypothetical protein
VANVTVFVDDAVLGHLPPVCVIEGVPTDDALTYTQQVGNRSGLGVAWLLVLAGPIGWLGLIVIAAFRQSGETLTVTVPFSEAAYLKRVQAERARLRAVLVTTAVLIAAIVSLAQRTTDYRLLALVLAVIGCATLSTAIVEARKVHRATVRLQLDASRRWLTLDGVHQSFVNAVQHRDTESRTRSTF